MPILSHPWPPHSTAHYDMVATTHQLHPPSPDKLSLINLLLSGGHTAYNRFKIPINLLPESTCNISKQSMLAELIQNVKLIIWDEAPMTHRYSMEAIARTLQDICNNTEPFGGKTVVFAGDRFFQLFLMAMKLKLLMPASINQFYGVM